MAEIFFERRNKAQEERDKLDQKDLLLHKYANPFEAQEQAKPQNQFAAKKAGWIDKAKEDLIRNQIAHKLKKLHYRYKPRADMPFWYNWEPEYYKRELDDNSMLSIDD